MPNPVHTLPLESLGYRDDLDTGVQLDAEEWIAATIFDRLHGEDPLDLEHQAQQLGRELLKGILRNFRPDLLAPVEGHHA